MSCGSRDAHEIGQGDQEPALEVEVKLECGDAFDFTGWTDITFTMEGPTTITGPAGVDGNVLSFAFGPGTTDVPGSYQGRFRGVSPTGKPRRFPTRGYIPVEVLA